jgi:hypothetical protein
MKFEEFDRRSSDYDRKTEAHHAPWVLGAMVFLALMLAWGLAEFIVWATRAIGRLIP